MPETHSFDFQTQLQTSKISSFPHATQSKQFSFDEHKFSDDFEDFLAKNDGEYYFFTRYGKKAHSEFDFSDKHKNIYLIFGKESTGIPKEILRKYLDRCIRIPCSDNVRCLNVANSVAIGLYEVMRQQDYPNLIRTEPFKGEDWLIQD